MLCQLDCPSRFAAINALQASLRAGLDHADGRYLPNARLEARVRLTSSNAIQLTKLASLEGREHCRLPAQEALIRRRRVDDSERILCKQNHRKYLFERNTDIFSSQL